MNNVLLSRHYARVPDGVAAVSVKKTVYRDLNVSSLHPACQAAVVLVVVRVSMGTGC